MSTADQIDLNRRLSASKVTAHMVDPASPEETEPDGRRTSPGASCRLSELERTACDLRIPRTPHARLGAGRRSAQDIAASHGQRARRLLSTFANRLSTDGWIFPQVLPAWFRLRRVSHQSSAISHQSLVISHYTSAINP
jgi:hypothetical protein